MLTITLTITKTYKSEGWSKQTFKIKVEFTISGSQNTKGSQWIVIMQNDPKHLITKTFKCTRKEEILNQG